MIVRDTDPKVVNKRVKRSELSKWLKKNKFIFKDSQIQYNDLRKTKDMFEWNKYKRSTISFERILQIRNRYKLIAKQK